MAVWHVKLRRKGYRLITYQQRVFCTRFKVEICQLLYLQTSTIIWTRIRHARWACYSIFCGELVVFSHLPSTSLRSDGGLRPPTKSQNLTFLKSQFFEIFKIPKVFYFFDFFIFFENFAVLKILIFLIYFGIFWIFSDFFG